VRQQQARERQQRKRNLAKYIPDVSRAIFEVLDTMADAKRRKKELPPEDEALLGKIVSEEVTEETLRQKLTQHVEQVWVSWFGSGCVSMGLSACEWVVNMG
jgi:DNA topoisomerase-6 subunit B